MTVQTLRIVAGDYTFAQIVEKLGQAEFNEKENLTDTALRAGTDSANDKKESRKCYYYGKTGHIKPDCKKKKSNEKKR